MLIRGEEVLRWVVEDVISIWISVFLSAKDVLYSMDGKALEDGDIKRPCKERYKQTKKLTRIKRCPIQYNLPRDL